MWKHKNKIRWKNKKENETTIKEKTKIQKEEKRKQKNKKTDLLMKYFPPKRSNLVFWAHNFPNYRLSSLLFRSKFPT